MDAPTTTPEKRFTEWCATLSELGGVASLLGWDRETVMPAAGADGRARQSGLIATMHHRELVRPDIDEVLGALEAGAPEAAMRRQLQLMRRRRGRAMKVPEELVRALSEATSRSVSAWIEARPANDYASFAGPFTEVVNRSREVAGLLAEGGEAYDALLDDYEPGARAATVEPLFAQLRDSLGPIVAERAGQRTGLPLREWPQGEPQLRLARAVAGMVGYDLERGLIGTTAHPFTSTAGLGDVRFSIRGVIRDPLENVLITLHEAGHAMYEQGFPDEYAGTPLHEAPSLGAHEAQSRFWENHVGRTPAFWERCLPVVRDTLGEAAEGLTVEGVVRAANEVARTPVRVDADEATYNLHIAVRFDLELRLFRGQVEVGDLPEAWDAQMEELVGVRPPSLADGVMQDIHWPEGLFGYFPTYTLGSVYAAQLAEAAGDALGGLDDAIADGRFADILGFMRERVHRFGNLLPTAELMRGATGRELSADALIAHLRRGAALA